MKRGMVQLSQAQVTMLLESLGNTSTGLVAQKVLSAHSQAEDPTQLELSEDELEQLLDSAPMPNQQNRDIVIQLRQQLQATLSELRSS
jgi:hypothetical protein